jgi:ABC-type glycerol-3-phosphate transport system permease component
MPVASAAFAVVGMEVPWGQICASVILLSIPPLILSYFFVKFLPYFFKVS